VLVINDLHIGVTRSGGTTVQSQQALRDYLRNSLAALIDIEDGDVVVNGDLFDSFTVDTSEVLKTADIFFDWLSSNRKATLHLIAGNHDWSPKADKVSSFHLLFQILYMSRVGDRTFLYDKGLYEIGNHGDIYAIPHMANQEAFDTELEYAASYSGQDSYLLLHCNYKNGFAENSDHSLNINNDQVAALMKAGWTLIIGHEHIGYELRGGRVVVVGNQFPSSVADCLGGTIKRAVGITDDGLEFVDTWSPINHYIEINWRDIPLANLEGFQFIRVTGEATSLESAEVIKVVSALRQSHDAFVVTNAVKIEGHDMSLTTESVESIAAFDMVGAIMESLDEREQETVKGLLP